MDLSFGQRTNNRFNDLTVFKNGQVVETIVGVLPKAQIHSKITAAL